MRAAISPVPVLTWTSVPAVTLVAAILAAAAEMSAAAATLVAEVVISEVGISEEGAATSVAAAVGVVVMLEFTWSDNARLRHGRFHISCSYEQDSLRRAFALC